MSPAAKKAAQSAGFNLGELSGYSSGGGVPEGDYCLTDFSVMMFQAENQKGEKKGPPRLGVNITLVPLGGGEERTQFYSMGSNADKSWAPNPATGKGIVPVAGGPGTPPNASTNWAYFVKSLFDCGLPQGILSDDLSVLEGIHVHMQNVPEPEERKGYAAAARTGEAGAEEPRGNKTIAVVSEIKDDGKPWEGTGGVPDTQAPKPAAGKAASKPPAKAASKAPVEQTEADPRDVATTAINTVMDGAKLPLTKLKLRTSVYKIVNEEHGLDMAQAVTNNYFTSEDTLNELLGELGFKLEKSNIVMA